MDRQTDGQATAYSALSIHVYAPCCWVLKTISIGHFQLQASGTLFHLTFTRPPSVVNSCQVDWKLTCSSRPTYSEILLNWTELRNKPIPRWPQWQWICQATQMNNTAVSWILQQRIICMCEASVVTSWLTGAFSPCHGLSRLDTGLGPNTHVTQMLWVA